MVKDPAPVTFQFLNLPCANLLTTVLSDPFSMYLSEETHPFFKLLYTQGTLTSGLPLESSPPKIVGQPVLLGKTPMVGRRGVDEYNSGFPECLFHRYHHLYLESVLESLYLKVSGSDWTDVCGDSRGRRSSSLIITQREEPH